MLFLAETWLNMKTLDFAVEVFGSNFAVSSTTQYLTCNTKGEKP